jgi:chaperonin cofactor prefoldin
VLVRPLHIAMAEVPDMLSLNNNSKSEQIKPVRHGHRGVWTAVAILLTISFAGAATWRLNSELKSQGSSIAKLLGMQKTVDSLSERMIGAETALSTFPAEMNKVSGRMDALDKKVTAVQKAATAKPTASASPAVAELGNSVAKLNEQIAMLQAQHEDDAVKMDSLRQDLANTRQETTLQFATVSSTIPHDAMPAVATLRNAVDRNEAGISSLANKIDRDRHEFEVREDRVVEIVPGVLLTIRSTNVGRQEVSGWIYLENDRRVIYLKNQGLLQPITVYGVYGKDSHDIVITRVRKDDAVGFVLSPKESVTLAAGN